MNWIALKMLTGDRTKYLGIVFGVAFATLLMGQQVSLFIGLMKRTCSQIVDVDAPIWVMENKVRYIDEIPALPDDYLSRVRGVEGVEWAERLYKGQVRCRLEDGNFRNAVLFGLDDASLAGAPRAMHAGPDGKPLGSLDDLRLPDAVIIDKAGYEYMWPADKEYRLGRVFEMNDRRAVLVGVCKASAPFTSMPILYTRYTQASRYAPRERNLMSFILAKPLDGHDIHAVCGRITEQTGGPDRGLLALTHDEFYWKTIAYFFGSTGIPLNFGITVALGFIVGVAIAGQTFYLFTVENLKQFGALKAMGLSNARIVGMILLQAVVVGVVGYGVGMGFVAAFFEKTNTVTALAGMGIPWQVMAGVAAAVGLIVLLASLLSIRKVLVLEPAVVFRG